MDRTGLLSGTEGEQDRGNSPDRGCGAVQSLPLNVRTYRCACRLTLDRDINAARNLANLVAGSSPETVNGRGERVSQTLPATLGETSTRAAIASGLARSCQT